MADNLRKYTTQEVLNKVYEDSSGNTIGINAATSKETLNAALDEANSRLNVSLAGGTISGDVTIAGDLTVTGAGGGFEYTEVITGDVQINGAIGTGEASAGVLVLSTAETTVRVGTVDQLGRIDFQAPSETGGSDAILVGASIFAEAEEDFSSTNNSTGLVFSTATTSAPIERMRIDQDGQVGIGTAAPGLSGAWGGIKFTVYDATSRPAIELANSTTADNTLLGQLIFVNADNSDASAATQRDVSSIQAYSETTDTNAGDDSGGHLLFLTKPESGGPAERMRIDSAGNVGIGEDDPSSWNALAHNLVVYEDGNSGITIASSTSGTGSLYFGDGIGGDAAYKGSIEYVHGSTNELRFRANSVIKLVLDPDSRISLSNNLDLNTSNTVFGKAAWNIASTSTNNASDQNVCIGEYAMGTGTINGANNNVAVGYKALEDVTTGDGNLAIGRTAGSSLTSGSSNVALGSNDNATEAALEASLLTSKCVAIGTGALGAGAVTVDGDGTISIGYKSLFALTSGAKNIAVGYDAMGDMQTGTNNIALGYESMNALQGGDGLTPAASANAGNHNIAIGTDAMGAVEGYRNNTEIDGNIAIGTNALLGGDLGNNNNYDFVGNIAIGYHAVDATGNTQPMTGTIGIGYQALTALTSGARNLAIGHLALQSITQGDANVAVGFHALQSMAATDGNDNNTAIGTYSMQAAGASSNVAANNTAVGFQSGYAITTGDNNVAIGSNALVANLTGSYNVAVGATSLDACTGGENTAIGWNAGGAIIGGSTNTLIGSNAGDVITTGDTNTILGGDSDPSANNSVNQTIVGHGTTGVADNSVVLGNASVTAVYMAQDSGATVHQKGLLINGTAIDNYNQNSGVGNWAFVSDNGSDQNNFMAMSSDSSKGYALHYINAINGANDERYFSFYRDDAQIGSIQLNGTTGVTYEVSSDKRLKENIEPLIGSLERLKELKPSTFNFISEPDRPCEGFIAQEVQPIIPHAVSGSEDKIDENGNHLMMGIDFGRIVPVLVGALQEATQKIESLEMKVTALEAK